jgi:phenylacetate-CoA ligase
MSPTANGLWERASAESISAFTLHRLLDTITRAYEQVPFYRRLYTASGLDPARLRTMSDVRRHVPFVTKADLLAFQDGQELAGLERPEIRQFHLTSGTTGTGREIHVRSVRDIAALGTGGAYAYLWAGLRPGQRLLLTIPYAQTLAGPYFQASCRAAGLVPVNGFALDTEARLVALRSYGCAGLSATPSHLHRLTAVARRNGLQPATDLPALSTIILSGEAYSLQWAHGMQKFWGAQIHEGWGATQTLGVALATCPLGAVVERQGSMSRGSLHALDHRVLVEVLNGEEEVGPGHRGEMVISTLRSFGMPCIRFRMGDEIRRGDRTKCACGMELSRYEAGTLRRIDDMMKIRGMNIWPQAVDGAVLEVAGVTDYRGSVYTDGDGREQVMLEVEATGGSSSPVLEDTVRRRVKAAIGVTPLVRIVPRGAIAEPAVDGDGPFKARRWRVQRAVAQERHS